MKFNSLNNLKNKIGLHIYLIAVAVILLFALIFGCIFGFNKSFDFTGGTQIVLDLGNDTLQSDEDKTIDEYVNYAAGKSKDIISSLDGNIYSLQVQETNFGRSLIINIRQKSASNIERIRLALNKEFNDYDAYTSLQESNKAEILDTYYDLTKSTTQIDGLILSGTVIACIAALVFALTLVTIYSCIRFKLAGALTVAFGGILDLLLFCAFMILSRIEINIYFFALLGIVLLVSIYNSASFFFDIKEKLRDPKFDSKTNKELADIVLKENFVKNVSIFCVMACIAVVVGLFGVVPILHLGLASVFAIVILFVTHNLILPDFWVLVNKKNNLVRPAPKPKKNEVEVVSQKNNKDKAAKVVEIDDTDEEDDDENDEDSDTINEEVAVVDETNNNESEELVTNKVKEENSEEDDEVIIEVVEEDNEDNTKKD